MAGWETGKSGKSWKQVEPIKSRSGCYMRDYNLQRRCHEAEARCSVCMYVFLVPRVPRRGRKRDAASRIHEDKILLRVAIRVRRAYCSIYSTTNNTTHKKPVRCMYNHLRYRKRSCSLQTLLMRRRGSVESSKGSTTVEGRLSTKETTEPTWDCARLVSCRSA